MNKREASQLKNEIKIFQTELRSAARGNQSWVKDIKSLAEKVRNEAINNHINDIRSLADIDVLSLVNINSINNQNEISVYESRISSEIFPIFYADNLSNNQKNLIREFQDFEDVHGPIQTFESRNKDFIDKFGSSVDKIVELSRNFIGRIFQDKKSKDDLDYELYFVEIHKNKFENLKRDFESLRATSNLRQETRLDLDEFASNKTEYLQELKNYLNFNDSSPEELIYIKVINQVEQDRKIALTADLKYFNEKINESWDKLKDEQFGQEIPHIQLDVLEVEYPNLPKTVLESVLPLIRIEKSSDIELMQIFSITEIEVLELRNAVKDYIKSYRKRIYPKLNPDSLSNVHFDLLYYIYLRQQNYETLKEIESYPMDRLDKYYEVIDSLVRDYKNEYHTEIQADYVTFNIREKQKYILENYNEHSNFIDLVKQIDFIINSNIYSNIEEFLKNYFLLNSTTIYSVIEEITGSTYEYIPQDIPAYEVQRIQDIEIDMLGLNNLVLRPYQKFGIQYALYNKNILLGDDMGLGKTIQALGVINQIHQSGEKHSIVITPKSVIPNWEHEIRKWTKLQSFTFAGSEKDRNEAYLSWVRLGGILQLNFEQGNNLLMHLNGKTADPVKAPRIGVVIVDEAHIVKNPSTKRSISTYKISNRAEYNIYMTGTAIENRLSEMKVLINVLQPKVADSLDDIYTMDDPKEYKRKIASVYLRRKRIDVLNELPSIEELDRWSEFSDIEQKYYDEKVEEGNLMGMRRAGFEGKTKAKSDKIDQLLSIVNSIKETGEKVVIFSYFKGVLNTIKEALVEEFKLGDFAIDTISGEVSPNTRQEYIDSFTESKNKFVLLSQIDAGGVGLNIQAASNVIICEPQYKPSTENQAIARVHRMGQTRNVTVYRLLTENSIDERLVELLQYKTGIFNTYAKDSEAAEIFSDMQGAEINSEDTSKILEIERENLEERKEKAKHIA